MIEVKDLRKNFGELEVLRGITTTIEKGERVVVIGPSGGGKSTFLRCLNLLEEPTSGRVFFEGEDLTDPNVDVDLARRRIGMVFQHFNLFPHLTIMQNITLAPVHLKMKTQAQAEEEGAQAPVQNRPAGQGRYLSRQAFRRSASKNRHCSVSDDEPGCDAFR